MDWSQAERRLTTIRKTIEGNMEGRQTRKNKTDDAGLNYDI